MAQTPRMLKNFTSVINGRGLAGKIDELTLPEISLKTEEYRAGGMDGPIEVDMGMEAMTLKLTISDPDAAILGLVGNANSNSARVTLSGSFVRDSDSERVSVVAEVSGRFKKGTPSSWKPGDKANFEYEAGLNYYRLTIGGVEVYEIDIENMVRRIGGVDQLAGIRADIGL